MAERATDARAASLARLEENPIRPFSQQEAKSVLADLRDWAKSEAAIAVMMAGSPPMKDFVVAALSLSPFLRDTARIAPSLLSEALEGDLHKILGDIVASARAAWTLETESELMSVLRKAKRRAAFLIALGDLSGLFAGEETTGWLSDLAEACAAAAIDHLLLAAHHSGKLVLSDPAEPSKGSGLIVLGMGKLGGRELNYSSDIDIVVFYEPEAGILADPEDGTETLARMLRRLIRILQDRRRLCVPHGSALAA
jgi:glutamate-ammonia-ligase adenylyltransferase